MLTTILKLATINRTTWTYILFVLCARFSTWNESSLFKKKLTLLTACVPFTHVMRDVVDYYYNSLRQLACPQIRDIDQNF